MRGDVEKDSAAGAGSLAPGAGLELRAVAVVSRFEPHNAAQRARRNKLANGLEIAIVPPVLIDGEQALGALGNLNQRNRLFESCCERFIDNHVTRGLKTLPCEGIVRVVGSGNHDQENLGYRA